MNTQILFLVRKTMACFGALALVASMGACSVGQPDDEDLKTEESGTVDSSKAPGLELQGVIGGPGCADTSGAYGACTNVCFDERTYCDDVECADLSGTEGIKCISWCHKNYDNCVNACAQAYCN